MEILTGDKVTLIVDRRDITKTPNEKSPACVKEHTEWTAKVTKFPNRSTETKGPHYGDEWEVEADWGLHWTRHLLPGAEAGPVKDQTIDPNDKEMPFKLDDKEDAFHRKVPPPSPPKGNDNLDSFFPKDVAENMRQADREAYMKKKDWHQKHQPVAEVNVDLTDMLKFWAWLLMPPTIDVTAKACSGSKTATIKVYPKDKFSFSFSLTGKAKMTSALATLKAAIDKIRKASTVAKRIFAYGGKTLDVQFMVGFKLTWDCQYIEHTKDEGYRRRIYTPATVGRDWTITIGADPLLGVQADITYSLLNFLAPGVGEAAASILRKLGVRVDFFFGIEIRCSINLKFGWNEYEMIKFDGVEVPIDVEPYAGAMAAALGVQLIFKIMFKNTFTLLWETSKKQGTLFQFTPKFHARVHITIKAKAWRWFTWKAYDGVPDPLQVHWQPGKLDLFTPPS